MHEFSLTQNLLDLALNKAASRRIVRVNLLIGPFADEREDSITFYWQALVKGSPAEGAELHFEPVPAEMKCLDCGRTFQLDQEGFTCIYCSSLRLHLLSGDDVRLESIEVE